MAGVGACSIVSPSAPMSVEAAGVLQIGLLSCGADYSKRKSSMDDSDKKLMAEHGITSETKTVFHYLGHRYERLADAVSYAKIRQAAPSRDVPSNGVTHID
jgi:hypothetical protein